VYPLSRVNDACNNQIIASKYDAILFDFDGVIADSEAIHLATKKYALDTFNIPYDDETLMSFQGCPEKVFFDFFAKKYDMSSANLLKVKRDNYAQSLSLITPINGAIGFMRQCAQNKEVNIVTSSIREDVEDFILRNALSAFIREIISSEDVINHKPNPEPYVTLIQRNQLIDNKCLVIEDSPNGILAAKAAGCDVVGLIGQFSKHALLKAGADFVVGSFRDLNAKIIW
jgi:beta-phosphoglucomutase